MEDKSLFYTDIQENDNNKKFINEIKAYAETSTNDLPIYVIDKQLGGKESNYEYKNCLVIAMPKHKLVFVDFGESEAHEEDFEDFVMDFCEDIGFLADKFNYKSILGRPREWKREITYQIDYSSDINFESVLAETLITDYALQRKADLVCSLVTGSINDINKVGQNVPETTLDKIKQKIILFDADQGRFIYTSANTISESKVNIQGLAGTGKTELLLHKLKDLYVNYPTTKIAFTCYSTILADNMKKRVPEFFNFLKVEEQIKWNERLWVMRSWGSGYDCNSGLYSYICNYYQIPFLKYSKYQKIDFTFVCKEAVNYLKNTNKHEKDKCFDFLLIDESQDFPKEFFELCDLVVSKKIYTAGDIFQNIYDFERPTNLTVDYLLNKCYRTDPKTLMFAHALGMGLYEKQVIRWLNDKEFGDCGYVLKYDGEQHLELSRKPIRRFSDIDEQTQNVVLKTTEYKMTSIIENIVSIIKEIKQNNPTVMPSDIAIIFVDDESNNSKELMYNVFNALPPIIFKNFNWNSNKGYESHIQVEDEIILTSKNYIKGLEYPFVICVAPENVSANIALRNSLYMVLTRSFLTSYFILNKDDESIISISNNILKDLQIKNALNVKIPTTEEITNIKDRIVKFNSKKKRYTISEVIDDILNQKKIEPDYRQLDMIKNMIDGMLKADKSISVDYKLLKKKIQAIIDTVLMD